MFSSTSTIPNSNHALDWRCQKTDFIGKTDLGPGRRKDSEFCADWQKSKNVVNCNSNGTNTLWRSCSGRRLIIPSCGNPTDANPGSDCPVGKEYEDESERPWVKWRALSLNEPNDPGPNKTQEGWTVDPSRPFHSLALEIISGQRFYPNGTLPSEDQVVLYSSKFTILRNMTRCLIDSFRLGYSCELEVSQLDPWMYRGTCVDKMAGLLSSLGGPEFQTPACGFRVPFKYRLTSLNDFKAAYWR